jgi:hypothetical protein
MANQGKMTNVRVCLFGAVLLVGTLSCASQKPFQLQPLITEEDDRKSIPRPKEQNINLYEDGFDNTVGREMIDVTNLSLHVRKLTNNFKAAQNVNALDEVPNSSWFTNRHGKSPMSIEELKRGPDRGTGPDLSGQFIVTGAKVEGVSPGFTVKDVRGDVYFIKFDIVGFPQLNTAAEVISTKFIYAAGYNTPENYISQLDPKKLVIEEGVTIPNRWGREIPMTFDYLQEVLKKVNPNPDGTFRVVASKRLEGRPLGPFRYVGTRKDDPNDYISHNKRRELRGYKMFAAWLNNDDAKANNSLDMYVDEDGRQYVKHYLIDFATSLGSSGFGASKRDRGHRGGFDLGNILKKMFSLGLWVEGWEKDPELISPSIGYFESRHFNPGKYAQLMPNPAFQRATDLDGFWAAKIIMSFTNEQIRAIVETGQYAKQEDADYIAKTLIERRDKTGRHWYGKINPLDNFRFSQAANGGDQGFRLEFDDLWVKAGFAPASETRYRYQLQYRDQDLSDSRESKSSLYVPASTDLNQVLSKARAGKASLQENDRILTFRIQTNHGKRGWTKDLKVHFYYPSAAGGEPKVVGIER